jgi:YidC/Oxa1 family membrane protein insertase
MRAMHSLTHNWGVAIILLTLTVKILLFPLNRLQSRTMEQFQKKMKLLQPQLDELKKKYKGNLQKLNVEQQKIMREHGVRPPIFGCLVVFLQMPVWYGLFQIMRSAPELRHAPFMLWIGDLSAPDVVPLPFTLPIIGTLHLLPILMVIAWLAQNRMMPKPTDPQQAQMQKMMNFFPFMMGFFLYSYASGQSLYMLTNSLLGMLQMKLLRVTPTN